MKLEKFDKNKKKKIYAIGGAVFLVVAIIGIVLFRSYALYQEEKSFNVLNGVVPDFSGDIQLAFTINGAKGEGAFPEKGSGYVVNNVTCNDGVEASWSNSDWALTNIKANNNTKIKCNIDFIAGKIFPNDAKVGDIVSMTPSKTSFNVPKTLTGYTTDQTIIPSNINEWKITKKNSDGTIEMVANAPDSNNEICFQGATGYVNFVGTLNYIARQYENLKYTISSRHVGYNGQTEYITDSSKITNSLGAWSTSTNEHGNQYESQGGGDTLYQDDMNLLKNLGSGGYYLADEFWLASRKLELEADLQVAFSARSSNGAHDLREKILCSGHDSCMDSNDCSHIRPILIIKSGITASSGSGIESDPWVLQ